MTNGDLKRFYGNKPQVGPNDDDVLIIYKEF